MTYPQIARSRSQLLKLIPPDAKVAIEIGSDTGELAAAYERINPHCRYIRLKPEIAFDSEGVGDPTLDLPPGSVDCFIYDSTIAHCLDPQAMLKRHLNWLKPDGQVVAAIANVGYWQTIIDLLRGKWSARETDPLHCFTLDTIRELLAGVGLYLDRYEAILSEESDDWKQWESHLSAVAKRLDLDAATFIHHARTQQYLLAATLSPPKRPLVIQTILMAPLACDRVRVLEPDRMSASIPGVRTVSTVKAAALNIGRPQEEKVFIWQRALLHSQTALEHQKNLLQRGYLIVAEMDDDPQHWPGNEQTEFFTFRSCHCVQTSTEPLAAELRQYNPYVGVFANQLTELPPPRAYRDDRVALFFGALNREPDWQPLMASINRILAELGDRVWVEVLHDRQFFQALATERKQFRPFCPYEDYHQVLHRSDIALLPLNPTRFNNMKSDLKFLECAGHGVAVLASPTVYDRSLVNGETGLLYRSVEEFEAKLRELVGNPLLRRQLGGNAYEWVKHNRLLSQHYRQRYEWYLEMRDRLPELNAALRDRLPQLFENS